MKKPIVLLSGQKKNVDIDQLHYGCNYQYISAVTLAGGIPLVLSDLHTYKDCMELAQIADMLILTGGQDINPEKYNQNNFERFSRNIDMDRDRFELEITKVFIQANKPILGICRGMQIINTVFGGELFQDIPIQLKIDYPYNVYHEISANKDTYIAELFGDTFIANSLHHQSISKLGDGLVVVAVDKQNPQIIEAIKHKSMPIFGVQWHPEKMSGEYLEKETVMDMLPLFVSFLKGALS